MKTRKFLVIGIIFMTIAIGFMLYPTICNLTNSFFSDNVIENYNNNVNVISASDKSMYLSEARNYNDTLKNKVSSYSDTEYIDGYTNILNFDNGIIGYLEIDKIDVSLPIYHGSDNFENDEEVLKKGAVHIPNTSFPIGGNGCHSVISAHTGYPTQVFFDNLPELENGDLIYIKILDDTLVYSVCDKNVVNPDDTQLLNIDEDRDLLSLITCYPYGVNSHRLIITADRIETPTASTQTDEDNTNSKLDGKCNTAKTIVLTIVISLMLLVFLFFIVYRMVLSKKGRDTNA